MTTNEIKTAKFTGKFRVTVRCGGRGEELVGETLTVKTKSGDSHAVRLVELLADYGDGDVAEYRIEYA